MGTGKLLDLNIDDTKILVIAARRLGQDIFSPPNVKGWPGGTNWINSHTLLLRKSILKRLQAGKPMMQAKKMRRITMHVDYDSLPSNRDALIKHLLIIEPVNPVVQQFDKEHMVADILSDPAYQVK